MYLIIRINSLLSTTKQLRVLHKGNSKEVHPYRDPVFGCLMMGLRIRASAKLVLNWLKF